MDVGTRPGERDAAHCGHARTWIWRVTAPTAPALAGLSRDEEADLARIVPTERRVRVRAAWTVRRALLARVAGCAPGDVHIERPRGAAPRLIAPDPRISFSFSHCDGWACLAVSRDARVGIDIERLDAPLDASRLARRFFGPDEARMLDALPAEERAARFVRLWTRKEALLKGTGGGVPSGLRTARVPLGAARASGKIQVESAVWSVQDLIAPSECAAALAASAFVEVLEEVIESPPILTP